MLVKDLLELCEEQNEDGSRYWLPKDNTLIFIDNRQVSYIEMLGEETCIEYVDDIGDAIGYNPDHDFNIEIYTKLE